MPSLLYPPLPPPPPPQYQKSLSFTRGGQPQAPPIFDCALEVLLAALGQLCRGEAG